MIGRRFPLTCLANGRLDDHRAGGRVDRRLRAERDGGRVRAVPSGKPAEDRNAEPGQPVPQDVDDAPPAQRRVTDGVLESEELAERDAVQTVQCSGTGQLGECAVYFAETSAFLVFEEEDRAAQVGQAGPVSVRIASRLPPTRTPVAVPATVTGAVT